MFALNFLIFLGLESAVSFMAQQAKVGEVNYSDVANQYVLAKYSNGYLSFWDKSVSENYSLMVRRRQEMHLALASNPKALAFSKNKQDLWKDLVLFCRKMSKKIGNGEDLGVKEFKHIGWCDKGDPIQKTDEMDSRGYWVDVLVKARYKVEDFKFWDEFSNKPWERVAKLHDLIRDGGDSRRGLELVKEAKVKCDALRNKFKTRFVERDLESIPNCLSSLRSR